MKTFIFAISIGLAIVFSSVSVAHHAATMEQNCPLVSKQVYNKKTKTYSTVWVTNTSAFCVKLRQFSH